MQKFISLALLFLGLAINPIYAQAPTTLNEQYLLLKDKSETYAAYKVIRESKLDALWKSVNDTISDKKALLAKSNEQLMQSSQIIDSLQAQLNTTQVQLAATEESSAYIQVLWMDIQKKSFVYFFWSILFVLAAVIGFLYIKFNLSNKVTRKTRFDHQELTDEFEQFRQRAREKEIRLKRELQTEMNTLEEMRQKFGLKKAQ